MHLTFLYTGVCVQIADVAAAPHSTFGGTWGKIADEAHDNYGNSAQRLAQYAGWSVKGPRLPPIHRQAPTRLGPTTAPRQDRHFCCVGQMKGMTDALETPSAADCLQGMRNAAELMEGSQGSCDNGRCDAS